jgi:Xaa-Pro aminopeptidase
MDVKEKLNNLRNEMRKEQIDVYLVLTADFHQSEYVGDYFQTRKFLSGFTGSAGTLVVTQEEAALFTDGRYFVQAEKELAGSTIRLMKMGMEGVPELKEYVKELMKNGKTLGTDGRMISMKEGISYASAGTLKTDVDLADRIWKDRPSLPLEKAWLLDVKYTGESMKDKILRIRREMEKLHADYHLVSSLDDIAWLFNIRGNDIVNNPVVLSHAVIGKETAVLFISAEKLSDALRAYFAQNNVTLMAYEAAGDYLAALSEGTTVLLDDKRVNYALYQQIPQGVHTVIRENPAVLMKAVKNETEIENERNAHIKDGAAVTKFMYWLKKNVGEMEITELSAAQKLEEFRKAQEGYLEPSFETISAYNANAAMMHYSAENGNNAVLEKQGALLVDSGGQYYEGTTDITRTIGLGEVSEKFKKHYTAVLKGMLNLSNAKFLEGCIGRNLDILAREPLWDMEMDYRCGTGHGVGYLLNVHEAPNAFRWKKTAGREDECVLQTGMITTDEPGVYVEGEYGIRIENELVVRKDVKNEYGQFLRFETLTMAPIDMDLIDWNDMEEKDQKRLLSYHQIVYEKIEKFLDSDEKKWFQNEFLINVIQKNKKYV